jgi:hypothetical protein
MTSAWYHGERANQRDSGPELAIVSLLLVGVAIVFSAYVRLPSPLTSQPAVQEASVTAARQAAVSPKGAVSIAVLPFLNLSSDKEQEFFSDGMTEEITAALAKIPSQASASRSNLFSNHLPVLRHSWIDGREAASRQAIVELLKSFVPSPGQGYYG